MASAADEFITHIQSLSKQVADIRRRQNSMIMTGVVKERQGQRVKLELSETDPHTKGEFNSPFVPVMRPSGKNGGGHSMFTKAGIGEAMLLISPGGELGGHSRAIHAGHTDDNPAPGSEAADGEVHTTGNVKIETKDNLFRATIGGAVLELTGAHFKLTIGGTAWTFSGSGLVQLGGTIEHDGKIIDKTHKHTEVVKGVELTGAPQ